MGDNQINCIHKPVQGELDLSNPDDQDLFIRFACQANAQHLIDVLDPILPAIKSNPTLDIFVVKLAIALLKYPLNDLPECEKENYRQVLIHLMSDEARAPERNTIYQLLK